MIPMEPCYGDLLKTVYAHGRAVRVRGMDTVEMLGGTVTIGAGAYPNRVKLRPQLGIVEGLQLIAGSFDLETIKRAAPGADHSLFGEDTAYGPRVKTQLDRATATLRRAPDSRRANVVIARATDVGDKPAPCTTSIQFLVRRGFLQTLVTMRSWDAAWGMPYDLMQFGLLARAVASSVGVLPGAVTVTAGSLHVYDDTAHLVKLGTPQYCTLVLRRVPDPGAKWKAWQDWASDALETFLNDERRLDEYVGVQGSF